LKFDKGIVKIWSMPVAKMNRYSRSSSNPRFHGIIVEQNRIA